MPFNKGQVIRDKDTPSQKYDVQRENMFGIDGAIKVRARGGPKHADGKFLMFVPHTPGIHAKSPGGQAKHCEECRFEADA